MIMKMIIIMIMMMMMMKIIIIIIILIIIIIIIIVILIGQGLSCLSFKRSSLPFTSHMSRVPERRAHVQSVRESK